MAWMALAATALGTVASVAGAEKQAQAENQMYQYQAQVANNNQTIANQNAQLALQQGQQQEAAKRQQTAQMIGGEITDLSAAGIDPTSLTSQRLQESTAQLGETDAMTIRSNALNTATGYRNQGLDFGAQAQVDQSAAQNALTAGNLNAFGSFASGTGTVANRWYQYFGPKTNTNNPALGISFGDYSL